MFQSHLEIKLEETKYWKQLFDDKTFSELYMSLHSFEGNIVKT